MTESHKNTLLKFREMLLNDALRLIQDYRNQKSTEALMATYPAALLLSSNLQRLDITLNSIEIEVVTPDEVTAIIGEAVDEIRNKE